MIGIIVLNWNGKEDTTRCLLSLEKLTYPHKEVVIVDNGSTDGSIDHFKTAFPHYTLLETGQNLGYAGGNNVGIEYGLNQGFDFFFLLNNDTIVDPSIIEHFLSTFEKHPQAGILGAKIYLMSEPTRFDHFGGLWNKKKMEFDFIGHRALDDGKSWESPLPLDYVCGAGIMVRRSVFAHIGLFDPRFFLFFEEADLCFRARRAGFEVLTAPQAKIWHKVSASFTGGKLHISYFYWRNRLLWIEQNFQGIDRILYFIKLLGVSTLNLYKLKFLKLIQLLILKISRSKVDTTPKQKQIQQYTACLYGVEDYLLRRFEAGRSSLFSKLKKIS